MLAKIRDYRMQRKWDRLLAQEKRAGIRRDKGFRYRDNNVHSVTSGHARHPKKGD
ncbi:hypothetical protein IGJ28_003503 [Enterococcus sp. AZ091]|uniref:hypothetical protein n=1 Tax=Enterococcus sp. AZ091 TaxID=2774720 RepID=UPI003F209A0D